MVKTTHEPYENPTIAEALCEIHFQRSDNTWNNDWLDAFADRLKGSYPTKEKKELRQIKAEIGPQGVSVQPAGEPVPRYVLKHKERAHLLQLSPFVYTANELPKYPGWKQFAADLQVGWGEVRSVSAPSKIKRIGLRYINRIPRGNNKEPLSEWLANSAYYPSKFLATFSKFVSRMEMRVDEKHRMIVTVAEGAQAGEKPTPIILDIDSIYESDLPTEWAAFQAVLDELHERAWDVFDSSATEKLKALLKGAKT